MKIRLIHQTNRSRERGAVAVFVAVILVALIGFTALAVDVGHLYGVKNELHNAADAGSLAGAHELFDKDNGDLTVAAAIAEAERVTPLNSTGNEMVNVNNITVETGHWSFTTSQFTASENTTQVEWQERPFSELDLDPAFINAVRVVARRPDTPSFFARIFSLDEFLVSSEAVAYIGFAGTLHPEDLDQPIAICKESITDPVTGAYTCNMGRMLNSGNVQNTSNTGAWTNFTQPCDTASTQTMRPLICADGNPNEVQFGEGIGSIGGVQDTTLDDLVDCWLAATEGKVPWNMTLPVVQCPGNNVSNCATLVGAVNVNVLWIIHQNDPQYRDVPREMTVSGDTPINWSCAPEVDGFTCWKSFVDQFNLQNVEGPPESDEDYEEMYQKKNIFFLPDCTVHEPVGTTGGENFGILAEIPVLVK